MKKTTMVVAVALMLANSAFAAPSLSARLSAAKTNGGKVEAPKSEATRLSEGRRAELEGKINEMKKLGATTQQAALLVRVSEKNVKVRDMIKEVLGDKKPANREINAKFIDVATTLGRHERNVSRTGIQNLDSNISANRDASFNILGAVHDARSSNDAGVRTVASKAADALVKELNATGGNHESAVRKALETINQETGRKLTMSEFVDLLKKLCPPKA